MASRPAQGNNSIRPLNSPRPAYKSDTAPKVTRRGTLSRPTDPGRPNLSRNVADATPKVIRL